MYGKLKSQSGECFKYRGLTITQKNGKIYLNQTDQIDDLVNLVIDKIDHVGAQKRSPNGTNLFNIDSNSELSTSPDLFRTAVAKSIWISSQNRPDIKLV